MRIRTHVAALAGITIAAVALIPAAADSGKIALCHATGSDSNPYVKIVVSTAAFYNSGHVAHAGDIFPAGSHKGQAWEAQGDQSILAAKCVVPAPEPTPSESATPDPTPTVTVTASPDPQPTQTVTVPAPTVTATETVPGPTVTATITPDGSVHPSPPTTTRPAPSTDHEEVVASAYPTRPADSCELGDPYESRMCETATQFPLPVESSSASSMQTALPAAPAKPGLPKAGN